MTNIRKRTWTNRNKNQRTDAKMVTYSSALELIHALVLRSSVHRNPSRHDECNPAQSSANPLIYRQAVQSRSFVRERLFVFVCVRSCSVHCPHVHTWRIFVRRVRSFGFIFADVREVWTYNFWFHAQVRRRLVQTRLDLLRLWHVKTHSLFLSLS